MLFLNKDGRISALHKGNYSGVTKHDIVKKYKLSAPLIRDWSFNALNGLIWYPFFSIPFSYYLLR